MITTDASNFRNMRTKAGLSQRALAVKLNSENRHFISQASISLIESGIRQPPMFYVHFISNLVGEHLTEIMPCCPTCGSVHAAGNCHGKPVASVAILAPGEAIAPVERIARDGQVIRPEPKPHKRQPRTSIEVHRETHAQLNELRQPGETWDALLNRLAQKPR